MTISIGDRIPDANLTIMTDDGPRPLSTEEIFGGKTVVLFSVPGAFTPTCSARHLPGFIDLADDLRNKGVDTIACLSVNDAFVMKAWQESTGAHDILMLADGNADFAKLIGLDLNAHDWGMGIRSQRFALVAKDGVVQQLFIEAPGEFRVSSAEHVLSQLG